MNSDNIRRANKVIRLAGKLGGNGDVKDDLVDLLTNVRHACDALDLSFGQLNKTAHGHYIEECRSDEKSHRGVSLRTTCTDCNHSWGFHKANGMGCLVVYGGLACSCVEFIPFVGTYEAPEASSEVADNILSQEEAAFLVDLAELHNGDRSSTIYSRPRVEFERLLSKLYKIKGDAPDLSGIEPQSQICLRCAHPKDMHSHKEGDCDLCACPSFSDMSQLCAGCNHPLRAHNCTGNSMGGVCSECKCLVFQSKTEAEPKHKPIENGNTPLGESKTVELWHLLHRLYVDLGDAISLSEYLAHDELCWLEWPIVQPVKCLSSNLNSARDTILTHFQTYKLQAVRREGKQP